jgi:hypothetical protein
LHPKCASFFLPLFFFSFSEGGAPDIDNPVEYSLHVCRMDGAGQWIDPAAYKKNTKKKTVMLYRYFVRAPFSFLFFFNFELTCSSWSIFTAWHFEFTSFVGDKCPGGIPQRGRHTYSLAIGSTPDDFNNAHFI